MPPVDVFVGTTAPSELLFAMVKLTALTPPKSTEVTPIKFVPEIETFVPGLTDVGVKPVITGCTKKFVALGTTRLLMVLKLRLAPFDERTTSGPVVTPFGAVTVNWFNPVIGEV